MHLQVRGACWQEKYDFYKLSSNLSLNAPTGAGCLLARWWSRYFYTCNVTS